MIEVHEIVIDHSGKVAFLWSDDLAAFRKLGATKIRRASHVEPTGDGRWQADLSPSGGPVLGPFDLRGQAIDAEREWLLATSFGATSLEKL